MRPVTESTAVNDLLNNLTTALKHDPKRSALLGFLALVLLFLFLRHRGQGPDSAGANADAGAATEVGGGMPAVPDISRGAQLVALWRKEPAGHLSRNLFASELNTPPAPATPESQVVQGSEEDGLFWRQLERALAARADREQYRRMLVEAAVKDSSKLLLTSVATPPKATGELQAGEARALIGETLVRVGDQVGEGERGPFTVVAIQSTHVILARDGHHLVLRLGVTGAELVTRK